MVEHSRLNEEADRGIVCLPAGHFQPSESLEDALKREIMKLGIQVDETNFVCKKLYVASNGEKENIYRYLSIDYEDEPVYKVA